MIWRRGCVTCRHGEVIRHGQATEYAKGWGVFGLPFDSGHVLALRVFPKNDFSPYRTIWHRDPGGQWSIYVDCRRLDTACPRYYGPACSHIGHAQIGLEWTGPASLRVTMDAPHLDWTLTAAQTPILRLLNAASPRTAALRASAAGKQPCSAIGVGQACAGSQARRVPVAPHVAASWACAAATMCPRAG